MASGRPKALLGYGWAHFVTYAAAVLIVSPLGLNAVAAAAAGVHAGFLVVAYLLMMRDEPRRAMRCLVHDIAPATVSSLALVAVALPVYYALSDRDAAARAARARRARGRARLPPDAAARLSVGGPQPGAGPRRGGPGGSPAHAVRRAPTPDPRPVA